jgi:hypothetical protein
MSDIRGLKVGGRYSSAPEILVPNLDTLQRLVSLLAGCETMSGDSIEITTRKVMDHEIAYERLNPREKARFADADAFFRKEVRRPPEIAHANRYSGGQDHSAAESVVVNGENLDATASWERRWLLTTLKGDAKVAYGVLKGYQNSGSTWEQDFTRLGIDLKLAEGALTGK